MDFEDPIDRAYTLAPTAACMESVRLLEHGDVREVDPEDQCNICMENYGIYEEVRTSPFATIMKMPCDHVFHSKCLHAWLRKANTCPSCRYALPLDEDDVLPLPPDDDVWTMRTPGRLGMTDILQLFSNPSSSDRPRANMRNQPRGMYI